MFNSLNTYKISLFIAKVTRLSYLPALFELTLSRIEVSTVSNSE